MFTTFDIHKMKRALRLAQRGRGEVSPNPRVGALIVSPTGTTIGEGYHHHYGEPHAEVMALRHCLRHGRDPQGATMYVTLEPCCFFGKTPPCVGAIKDAGIKKVVVATYDPDPHVNGRGIRELRDAGIQVEVGLLGKESRYINRGFFSFHIRGRAWCTVKVAVSLDGRMADPQGMSQWITSLPARRIAHKLRADHDGVLVGAGTLYNDDPLLTVRLVKGVNPVRVILAPHRGIPPHSKLAHTVGQVRTILVAFNMHDVPGQEIEGIKILHLPDRGDGTIAPLQLLETLPEFGVLSLLIEGGSQALSSFMQAGVVDEVAIGIAPSVIGRGMSPFEYFTPPSWEERPRYNLVRSRQYGEDMLLFYLREEDPFSRD